jgi:hypothetical protein
MSYPKRTAFSGLGLLLVLAGLGVTAYVAEPTSAPPPALADDYSGAAGFVDFLAGDTAAARWYERYAAASDVVAPYADRVARLPGRWHLLVVAETWCTDALNSVPYLARLAEQSANLELRVVRRADAQHLLDAHRVDGRGRIPLVLVLDESRTEWGAFIERPAALVRALETPSREDRGTRVRAFYAEDGGRAVLDDVVRLLEGAARGVALATGTIPDSYEQIECGN